MDVRADPRARPGGQHERRCRQRLQVLALDGVEHRGRGRPVQRATRPRPGHLAAPAPRLGAHRVQAAELPAPPERVPNIGHRPLDLGLVLGLERPGRVDQGAVVRREFGIRTVDLRVVEVGPVHPGLEVVRDQPSGYPGEERERLHVRGAPLGLVHAQRRAHEHVPRAAQHHHERPHRAPPPAARVQPHPQLPVVDLRFLPRRWGIAQHRDLPAAGVLGQVGPHPPAQTGHAGVQPALINQPLMNRRRGHPGLEPAGDVVAVRLDPRPGHLPQPAVGQLREPARHQRAPVGLAHRRPTRRDPGRDGRAGVLAQRLTVHTQAGRQLVLRPARVPMDQNLHNIDHFEGPPRHSGSTSLLGNEAHTCVY